ncbi:unnamed protein product [Meganyctiphanes norvegica]|uniref:Uncharacterized protein n=1 Tax=Meganyctiphanes norvegica TaxID=48144 RepID=A0AAV2RCK9_MEGNR
MVTCRGSYILCSFLFILILKETSSQVVFPTPSPNGSCQDRAGRQGTCRIITECRSALDNLQVERPTICEFRGRIPVVCCIEAGVSPPNSIPECGRQLRSRQIQTNELLVNRIANGAPSDLNEWPWMALLGEKVGDSMNWFCSGVLINSKWILTAAHCTNRRNATVVRLGEYNFNDDNDGAQHMDVGVARVIFHDDYKLRQVYHDLSLIELDQHVGFTDGVSPLCLPWGQEGNRNLVGRKLEVTGWGAEFLNGPLVEILMEAELKGFTNGFCEENYSPLIDYPVSFPEGINQKILCIGDDTRQGVSACGGDSGGPSVYQDETGRYLLGGIVSAGYGCGKNDFPGIQVKVAHPQNLAWIKKHAFA